MARRAQPASYDFGDDYAAALREHDPQARARAPARSAARVRGDRGPLRRAPRAARRRSLDDPRSRELYASLATAEVRHRDIFLALARDASPSTWRAVPPSSPRLEAEILANRAISARIH